MRYGVIIVLYKPSTEQFSRLRDFCEKADFSVVVVENHSPQYALDKIEQQTQITMGQNQGIAAAINAGVKSLHEKGCQLGILFDQDSQYSDSLVKSLVSTYENFAPENTAAIGPSIYCQFEQKKVRPFVQRAKESNEELDEVSYLISSGKVINIQAYQKIGGMLENLFIDGVDHEWCWRAANRGYGLYQASNIELPHKQGEGRIKILGAYFKVGKPFRLYYQFRNILLLSKFQHAPFYWKVRHLVALPVRFLINAIALPERRKRVTFMFHGVLDGIRGIEGKYKER